MTSIAPLVDPPAARPAPTISPTGIAALDRFAVPAATCSIAETERGRCVVLDVTVRCRATRRWGGGDVLEVTVEDGTGSLCLVFFGRRCLRGLVPGRRLTAAGTAGRHAGRLVLINPVVWLTPRAPAERTDG